MNYYRRYPGDYARDTRHLTLAEHGAYTLLLDYLYGTQRVLPGLALGLYRICGAHSEEEKKAVDSVVDQFFEKTAEGYVNNRVTSDITKAESRIKAAIENGKKGGRRHQEETQKEPSGLAERQADLNPGKSYPSSIHQPPIEETHKEAVCVSPLGSDEFKIFFADYPIQTGRTDALHVWVKRRLDFCALDVMAALEKWKECERWQNPQYIPYAAKWLSDQWRSEPVKGVSKNEQKRQGTKQAIERVRAGLVRETN